MRERALVDGDLVMIEIEVPFEDRRPAIRPGSVAKVDRMDAQDGNPLKNGGNPEDIEV